jgi:hypothetical protein
MRGLGSDGVMASRPLNWRTDNEDSHPKLSMPSDSIRELLEETLERATMGEMAIELVLKGEVARIAKVGEISVEWKPRRAGVRREMFGMPTCQHGECFVRLDGKSRASHVRGIARGRRWLSEILGGRPWSLTAIAAQDNRTTRWVQMNMSLAFLDPFIVMAALEGKISAGSGQRVLAGLPVLWNEQRELLSWPESVERNESQEVIALRRHFRNARCKEQ